MTSTQKMLIKKLSDILSEISEECYADDDFNSEIASIHAQYNSLGIDLSSQLTI